MTTSPLPGLKTLLMGAPGTGKTTALHTYLEAGITPFVLLTEPGMDILQDYNKDKCRIHWHYHPPGVMSFAKMAEHQAKKAKQTQAQLAKVDSLARDELGQFDSVYGILSNFTCHNCGESFGPVDQWGTDRAIIVDGLTKLSEMAKDGIAGMKPVFSQGDWGRAIDDLSRLLNSLVMGTRCWFTLIAHIERKEDPITGSEIIMPSTIGRKLPPILGGPFNDVILAVRRNKDFRWSTSAYGADVKGRNLPLSDDLPPTFVQIVNTWTSRGGLIEPTPPLPTGDTTANVANIKAGG